MDITEFHQMLKKLNPPNVNVDITINSTKYGINS